MEHLLPQPSGSRSTKSTKRVKTVPATQLNTIKYLSVCRDPAAYRAVLKTAPDSVIKTICDAALNVQRGGQVKLSVQEKKLFGRHRKAIESLVSKTAPIAKKRKVLSQRGGAFFIPALIGAALGGLGMTLFGGNKS